MTGPGPHNAGSTPQPPQAPLQLHEGPPASDGSRRNLIVAVAVIALIVIIGLVILLVTKKSPDQGAPQTGSIQQPAMSSAGGYTPIDPASMVAPGQKVPTNTDTFLDQVALPDFVKYLGAPGNNNSYDITGAACWYTTGQNNQWFASQPGDRQGTVTCGPATGATGQSWWLHTISADASGKQSLFNGPDASGRWNPAKGVPTGFRPDGRPLPTAG